MLLFLDEQFHLRWNERNEHGIEKRNAKNLKIEGKLYVGKKFHLDEA
jgi:hypothetical protein